MTRLIAELLKETKEANEKLLDEIAAGKRTAEAVENRAIWQDVLQLFEYVRLEPDYNKSPIAVPNYIELKTPNHALIYPLLSFSCRTSIAVLSATEVEVTQYGFTTSKRILTLDEQEVKDLIELMAITVEYQTNRNTNASISDRKF